jgi:hypothetical protein
VEIPDRADATVKITCLLAPPPNHKKDQQKAT